MRVKYTGILVIVACLAWIESPAQTKDSLRSVRILCFGDINLGRTVGKLLLQGQTDYPFAHVKDTCAQSDIVFANLESVISDQHGETQSPKSNFVFCAPPIAAQVLHNASFNIVSTANNHAFDYGRKGMKETIKFLHNAGVAFTGTTLDSASGFLPVISEFHGIRIGFLAYTQFVNINGKWAGMISLYDSIRARKEIDSLRKRVDFVITSFHGGDEYFDTLDSKTELQLHQLADYGSDIVIGHHPHVPRGIFRYRKSIIFGSLGNFVFYQPQKYWTQLSFGIRLEVEKDSIGCTMKTIHLLPLRAGYQPSMNLPRAEQEDIIQRIQKLSNVTIDHTERGYCVKLSKSN